MARPTASQVVLALAVLACVLAHGRGQASLQDADIPHNQPLQGDLGAACPCTCENDLLEQLLGVVGRAAEQYEALAERYVQLKQQWIAREAVLAFPLELSLAGGLILIIVSSRLAASRARRKGRAEIQELRAALEQRTVQWEVAARESTDLAALLEQQRQQDQLRVQTHAPPHGPSQQQQQCTGAAEVKAEAAMRWDGTGDIAAADTSSGRDTNTAKVRAGGDALDACRCAAQGNCQRS